jgi:multidrug resistance efflux pump
VRVAEATLAQVLAGASDDELEAARAAVASAREEVALAEEAVALSEANVDAGEAALRAAQAELAKLRSGISSTDLDLAEAQIDLAESSVRGAQSARASIGGAVERGEMPEASHAAARAVVAQAETGVRVARLQLEELEAGPRLEDVDIAQAAVEQARADLEAARSEVERAQWLLEGAHAGERHAQAQLNLALLGAPVEQIAIARAQVSGALAAERGLSIRKQKMTLRAPRDGLVLERLVSVGETLLPGSVLFRLGDLGHVELAVYVPATDLGQIRLGQGAAVTVDSFPGRTFSGKVVHIGAQAEFTPRNVQSDEARTTQVFAVKIGVSNPDRALKPGMPADAVFTP